MWWKGIEKGILKATSGLAWIAGIILAGMMVMIIADVIMRYAFNAPIKGVLEITEEMLMIAIVFLTLGSADHIRVTFLTEHLSPRIQNLFRMITLVPAIVFLIILDYRSFLNATFSYVQDETSWGSIPFPLYPSRFLLFIGFTLFTLRLVVTFVRSVQEGKEV